MTRPHSARANVGAFLALLQRQGYTLDSVDTGNGKIHSLTGTPRQRRQEAKAEAMAVTELDLFVVSPTNERLWVRLTPYEHGAEIVNDFKVDHGLEAAINLFEERLS